MLFWEKLHQPSMASAAAVATQGRNTSLPCSRLSFTVCSLPCIHLDECSSKFYLFFFDFNENKKKTHIFNGACKGRQTLQQ